MSEGDLWRRQRRLMAPLFQPANLSRYAQVMTQAADTAAARWTDGPIDLADEMTRVTMGIVGSTLFGSEAFDGASDISHAITELLDWVNESSASTALVAQVTLLELSKRLGGALKRLPGGLKDRVDHALQTPFLIPNAFSPRLRAAKATLDTRLLALIAERRKNPVERDDLLSRLLAAQDADGSSMTDQQLRDESVTLFVAGHETTANALAWTFSLLAKHPQVRARLQAEVDALGGQTPGFHDVLKVPLAVRVFKEALRLYPPLTVLVRQATEAFTITGVDIPQGQILIVPTWSLHRNPEVWPNPEAFDPDRFLPEREAGRHRAAWLPFGLGPRVCIGNHFAMMEGPLVLTRLLQLVDFELDATRTVEPDDFATLRPRGGVWAKARRKTPR
jgi:cytochrome P450